MPEKAEKHQPTDKQKALELVLGQIEKEYGKGAIMRLEIGRASCRERV